MADHSITRHYLKRLKGRGAYLFILANLCLSMSLQAREIHIPDANFKAHLIINYDTNGDFEISVAEAAAVTGLLNCSFLNISDLTGIEAFVNIEQLYCFANQLASLPDISTLTQLKILDCSSNNIEELPHLCDLVLLEHLIVHSNLLEELPIVDNLPNLVELTCNANNFTLCNYPAIYLIDLMGLTTFQYNPQKNGQTLNCPLFPDPPPNLCFPDTVFKLALLATPGVDADSNGQISVVEAANFSDSIFMMTSRLQNLGGVEYFSSCWQLQAEGNQLTSLPAFCRLMGLQVVNVRFNELSSLPELSCLPNLMELEVGSNSISKIPNFSNSSLLRTLYLDHNLLIELPTIDHLSQLEILNARYNQIKDFPLLPDPSRIVYIDLRVNRIESLPDLSNQVDLERIDLEANCLTTVADFIGNQNLVLIDLSQNGLRQVPHFSNLPAIRSIWLNENLIDHMDPLTEIPSLEDLNLSYNKLETLPENWSNLPNLMTLDLRMNQIDHLPAMDQFPVLNWLLCSNNRLTQAPEISQAMTRVRLEHNLLDESQCRVLLADAPLITTFSYSPQGGFFLMGDLEQWPGHPSPLFEWIIAVSNSSYEYDLICQ